MDAGDPPEDISEPITDSIHHPPKAARIRNLTNLNKNQPEFKNQKEKILSSVKWKAANIAFFGSS